MIRILFMTCVSAMLLMADLAAVRSEPDLERRSEKALENSDKALDAARSAYQRGDMAGMKASLNEVQESVELALQSLRETGKQPAKITKHYKRGELKTRRLQRRLESFTHDLSVEEREAVEAVTRRVREIHDDFLNAVMSRKKKS